MGTVIFVDICHDTLSLEHKSVSSLSGLYPPSVGPLHSDLQYDISASKEGFVLTPVEGTTGDFKAFALAGVTFEVCSEENAVAAYFPCVF